MIDPLQKFRFYQSEFKLPPHEFWTHFEAMLRDSLLKRIECSHKIDGKTIHSGRVHGMAKGLPAGFIDHIRPLIRSYNAMAVFETIFSELNAGRVVMTIFGADIRDNPQESRIKLWFHIDHDRSFLAEVIKHHGYSRELLELFTQDSMGIGFDFYLDGREKIKLYPYYHLDGQNADLTLGWIARHCGEKVRGLAKRSEVLFISFEDKSFSRIYHFQVKVGESLWDYPRAVKSLQEMYQKIHQAMSVIAVTENNLQSGIFDRLNVYF